MCRALLASAMRSLPQKGGDVPSVMIRADVRYRYDGDNSSVKSQNSSTKTSLTKTATRC